MALEDYLKKASRAAFPQMAFAADVRKAGQEGRIGYPGPGKQAMKRIGGAVFPQVKSASELGRVLAGPTTPSEAGAFAERTERIRPATGQGKPAIQPAQVEGELIPKNVSDPVQYGGTNVYKYTPTAQERDEYGSAIFSDSPMGATPGGLDAAIRKGGQGVFNAGGQRPNRTDQYGNSLDVADSINRAVQIMRQTRRGGRAAQQPVGGAQQPGGFGMPQIAGFNQQNPYQMQAAKLMEKLPYGKPGDYRKRQSMLEQAKVLMGLSGQQQAGYSDLLGAQTRMADIAQRGQAAQLGLQSDQARLGQEQARFAQQQAQANRQFGLDVYKTMNPADSYQYIAPQYDDVSGLTTPERIFNRRTGDFLGDTGVQQIPYQSGQEVENALTKGEIDLQTADRLMSKYFPDYADMRQAERK